MRRSLLTLTAAAYDRLIQLLAVLAGLIIVGIFALIIIDVTLRTMGFSPPAMTFAAVEYGLFYFALFSAPYLTRTRAHVYIDALRNTLPARVRSVLATLVYALCVIAVSIFAYLSMILLHEAIMSGETDLRGVELPLWSLYLPMPGCLALVAVEFARYLFGFGDMYGAGRDFEEGV